MRGVYTVSATVLAVTTGKTLMYLTAPGSVSVRVISADVTNMSNETNEQLRCTIDRISNLGNPTATTITPEKHEQGDQAAASTVKYNVTANEPIYAANSAIGQQGFPSLNGWYYQPTDMEEMYISPSQSRGIRTIESITSADFIVRLTFREIG